MTLNQESLNVATRTDAAKPADFSKVIVDTTVQPKAVAFPTDAKLMHRARERLVKFAKQHGVRPRQSYERVVKRALIAISATPTPSNSSAQAANCAECGPISARVPRHRAQDQTQRAVEDAVRAAAVAGLLEARAAIEAARKEDVFAARSRGRMHRKGQAA